MPGTLLEEEVGNMFSRLWRDFRYTTKYAIFWSRAETALHVPTVTAARAFSRVLFDVSAMRVRLLRRQ